MLTTNSTAAEIAAHIEDVTGCPATVTQKSLGTCTGASMAISNANHRLFVIKCRIFEDGGETTMWISEIIEWFCE